MDPRLETRIAEKKQQLDQQRPLSGATVQLLEEELQSFLTYHSNAIEGNTLSLRETRLVIAHGVTIAGHSLKEHLEATNHAEAYRLLTHLATTEEPITIATIQALHQLVMEKLLDAEDVGQFRSMPVHISGSRLTPPAAKRVQGLMREWCAWLSGAGQVYLPVVRAAIAHHGFLAVHPYRDGNGRTARLVLNLMLMREGYPPALLLQEWRLGYLQALAMADTGRLNPLINLIGRAVEQGLDLYLTACARTPHEDDQELILLSDLAAQTGQNAEYLALLIRKGRLAGTKRGSRWYSSVDAVRRYEQEVRDHVVQRGRPRAS
jgi:Fic family protein